MVHAYELAEDLRALCSPLRAKGANTAVVNKTAPARHPKPGLARLPLRRTPLR